VEIQASAVKIGLVGLGLLGHAVATRLLAAGHGVIGHDVIAEKNAALAASGGDAAGSITAVTKAAGAVCVLLPSLATVEEAILGAGGVLAAARPGQMIAQMSTISPTLTERLAREVSGRGVEFLDCPVSGTSAMVERGDGILMVGGERSVYDRWRPVLEHILPRAFYVGRAGQAMVVKLIANLLVGLNSAAAAEALNMAKKAGLDPGAVLDILNTSAGASRMLEVRGPMIVRGEFPPQMKLDLFMKDLHLILDAGRSVGASLPLTTVAERLYHAVCDDGHAAEDLAVVVRALDRQGGG
jgi:3-hydroxyisobutyrate dehydrogenase-like beta-hydroxyacid dehydrogenase